MTTLNSSTCLKVKRDTFYLPDPEGGVYFRNNVSSFRMEGNTIYQWIEKLMPMFNGGQTLGDLTEGLAPPYRNRVYEIAEALYKNGFVRDVSQDTPHQLNSLILEKYASQIEFLENFVDSSAYRFQEYREANVLAVGSGPLLVSLATALLDSGLSKLNVMVTDSLPTNRLRLKELVQNASRTDSEVEIKEVPFNKEEGRSFWKKAVQPYDWILYVSQDGNVKELLELNQVCKEERKAFLPAIWLEQVGLAGPLVHPESEECWESAWRRIHQTALQAERQPQTFSSTAGSILANVMVFECFKRVTGVHGLIQSNQIYLLDLETLEGDWFSFITHPLVTSKSFNPSLVEDLEVRLMEVSERNGSKDNLLEFFSGLTSEETGIFHTWEERDLTQLPLSQCYVQAVNPLSEGPADLLHEVICSGLTHEEAKREAGLKGIEMYVSKMIDSAVMGFKEQQGNAGINIQDGFIGIGAGATIEEAVCRGLYEYLEEELTRRQDEPLKTIFRVHLGTIEDQRCRFYLNALTTLNGEPLIGLEKEMLGFPVIWVRTLGRRYTSTGLHSTLALRSALQQAIFDTQNQVNSTVRQAESAVLLKEKEFKLDIPSFEDTNHLELLQYSIKNLNRNGKQLLVYDFAFEPFLKHELAGVYGVQLGEGES
ncbi:putative thiazole-containing bacteriocin maturation protein [Neobacillus sp. PS3-34]|uniref:putative thiazole-containing bacteriocin maturation protein n=1 Tax=Neobacillus sp. PS3-34 TaxID=3070678 RepID=UPI0027E01A4B|nr:putative thiazole-containing bacteriocin maturation protein [Neobacillus sp. PS3-34]WML48581.1 putative thiazole-containing bacteriocin maturation protein [Neobacillus sp. PS3-34]